MHRARALAPAFALVVATLVLACRLDTGGQGDSAPPVGKAELPDLGADTACAWYFQCNCDQTQAQPFASEDQCADELGAALQAAIDEGEQAGLDYDAACAGEWVALLDDLGCDQASTLDAQALLELAQTLRCKLYSGDVEVGGSCTTLTLSASDSCIADAGCIDATCVEQAAAPAPGEPCEVGEACAEGAVCVDADETGQARCELLPGDADACLGIAELCAEGLTCSQTLQTCQPAPAAGEQCASTPSQCQPGLYCSGSNRCTALPPLGEPCAQTEQGEQCAAGLSCVDGECRLESALTCTVAPALFG